MTEMTVHKPKLPPAVERFVLHWGEMGAIWGTNRSIGQIHALLYLSDKPLTAEEIADTLGLARSNVSNSLKELLGWSLVRREHVMGDRRDYFAAETDLWEMVRRIAEGRKAREIDPTLEMLRTCLREANEDRFISSTVRERVSAMHDFVSMLDTWAADMRRVPRAKLALLVRLGAAIVRYLPGRMSKPGVDTGGSEEDGHVVPAVPGEGAPKPP
jgi:DNA-binding transcriptional regulator GbsR (MarR family)